MNWWIIAAIALIVVGVVLGSPSFNGDVSTLFQKSKSYACSITTKNPPLLASRITDVTCVSDGFCYKGVAALSVLSVFGFRDDLVLEASTADGWNGITSFGVNEFSSKTVTLTPCTDSTNARFALYTGPTGASKIDEKLVQLP